MRNYLLRHFRITEILQTGKRPKRTYNKYYLNNPPKNSLVLMDEIKGVLLYQPFPDGTLGIPREWNPFREAEVQEIKDLQHLPLENFSLIFHEKTGQYAILMDHLDANGKKIGALTGKDPAFKNALKKAIQIISKKPLEP